MNDHPIPPTAPVVTSPLPAANPNEDMLRILAHRRSTPIAMLSGPGPDTDSIMDLLRIAARVPDHRKLCPWRFIVITAREHGAALGERLLQVRKSELGNEMSEADVTSTLNLFQRAPVCIAVVSSPNVTHKTPVWEQELSAGAACQNLLLAANAMGWAGAWLTEWCAFSKGAADVFGLNEQERVAGFIHLGTAKQDPPERPRPDLNQHVTTWSPFG